MDDELRDERLKLHDITIRIINDYEAIDEVQKPGELAFELELQMSEKNADSIMDVLAEFVRLCPDELKSPKTSNSRASTAQIGDYRTVTAPDFRACSWPLSVAAPICHSFAWLPSFAD